MNKLFEPVLVESLVALVAHKIMISSIVNQLMCVAREVADEVAKQIDSRAFKMGSVQRIR